MGKRGAREEAKKEGIGKQNPRGLRNQNKFCESLGEHTLTIDKKSQF